jgi:twinkle protein
MKQLTDEIDFDRYFQDHADEGAKVRPASEFVDAVIDRFYGAGQSSNWIPMGFAKAGGKFDFRPGEVTLWAGVNKHGKTTFLSHVMLNVMQAGQKVCVASMEMKPPESMAKMTRQASGVEQPSIAYIKAFHSWTNGSLWIYNHLGRLAAKRALAIATYVRKELAIDHLVIDSLMKCGIGVDDLTGQKDFVDALCAIARDTGLHIHLVCHMRKGENERVAPGKFDVKGAGEITDMVDNIVIVWKNLHKQEAIATAERKKSIEERAQALDEALLMADSFVRIAGQRNHSWEGSFAFWFDAASQQFKEGPRDSVTYIDLPLIREVA